MIILDGVEYNCDVSFDRSVKLDELYRVTTKDNLQHRKVAGKKYTMNISFASTKDRTSYDALFSALESTVPYHTLTAPWGTGTVTKEVMITSVSDTISSSSNGTPLFSGLKVTFEER